MKTNLSIGASCKAVEFQLITSMIPFIFYTSALTAIIAGVCALVFTQPVKTIKSLSICFAAISVLFFLLKAPYTAVIYIILSACFILALLIAQVFTAEKEFTPGFNAQWIPSILIVAAGAGFLCIIFVVV